MRSFRSGTMAFADAHAIVANRQNVSRKSDFLRKRTIREMVLDKQHDKWNEYFLSLHDTEVVYDDWLDAYIGFLNTAKHDPIIDLGCGSGNNTKYLVERGFSLIACDYSSTALERIKHTFPGVETRLFDMRDGLPFPNNCTYAVLADLSIHYFDWATTKIVLKDIYRVLKHGGYFFCRVNSINDVNHGSRKGREIERNYYENNGENKRFFEKGQIDELFDTGWNVMSVTEKELKRYEKEKVVWEIVMKKE